MNAFYYSMIGETWHVLAIVAPGETVKPGDEVDVTTVYGKRQKRTLGALVKTDSDDPAVQRRLTFRISR